MLNAIERAMIVILLVGGAPAVGAAGGAERAEPVLSGSELAVVVSRAIGQPLTASPRIPGALVPAEEAGHDADPTVAYHVTGQVVGNFRSTGPQLLLLVQAEKRESTPNLDCLGIFADPVGHDGQLAWDADASSVASDPWYCAELMGVPSRLDGSSSDAFQLAACVRLRDGGVERWTVSAMVDGTGLHPGRPTRAPSLECKGKGPWLLAGSGETIQGAVREVTPKDEIAMHVRILVEGCLAAGGSATWDMESGTPVLRVTSPEAASSVDALLAAQKIEHDARSITSIDVRTGTVLEQGTAYYLTGVRGVLSDEDFDAVRGSVQR